MQLKAVLALSLAMCAIGAGAEPAALLNHTTVAATKLAQMRGGFDSGQGLQASFGLERSVAVNGTVVVSQSIQIPDLSRISAAQAEQLRSVLSGFTLVSSGPSNALVPIGTAATGGATVIQNTLDGQAFKSLTVINATTNSLSALQAMNASASLRNALMTSALPRP